MPGDKEFTDFRVEMEKRLGEIMNVAQAARREAKGATTGAAEVQRSIEDSHRDIMAALQSPDTDQPAVSHRVRDAGVGAGAGGGILLFLQKIWEMSPWG